MNNEMPRFLRLKDIIGDRRENIPAIIPVSKTSWYTGVRKGTYPKPVNIAPRTTAWREEDIRAVAEKLNAKENTAHENDSSDAITITECQPGYRQPSGSIGPERPEEVLL